MKKNNKCVCFFAKNGSAGFSGGRYHLWLMAEAFADMGWEVHYLTNDIPFFYKDFDNEKLFPRHKSIKLHIGPIDRAEYEFPDINCSVFVVGPHFHCCGAFALNAIYYITKKKLSGIFINFESPNWFNTISPVKRDIAKWDGWLDIAHFSKIILSSAKESTKFAKEFYGQNSNLKFKNCWAPINTRIADTVETPRQKKRILMLARTTASEHKGVNLVESIVTEQLSGYSLVIIVGSGKSDDKIFNSLKQKCSQHNVNLIFLEHMSEIDKWKEFKRASLIVFPSFFEGFGLPPVEARYSETPCVAFDLPVLREVNGNDIHYTSSNISEMRDLVPKILKGDVKEKKRAHMLMDFNDYCKAVDNIGEECLEIREKHLNRKFINLKAWSLNKLTLYLKAKAIKNRRIYALYSFFKKKFRTN